MLLESTILLSYFEIKVQTLLLLFLTEKSHETWLLWRVWQKNLTSSVLGCHTVCSVRVPDVSKEHSGFSFRIKQSKESSYARTYGTCVYFLSFRAATFLAQLDPEDGDPAILQNVGGSLPKDRALHFGKTES